MGQINAHITYELLQRFIGEEGGTKEEDDRKLLQGCSELKPQPFNGLFSFKCMWEKKAKFHSSIKKEEECSILNRLGLTTIC